MSSYTTRYTNATTGDHLNANTAGQNEAGFLDKLVGKTEEKIGELKKDPKMAQEGAIRATDGKVSAEHFKDGVQMGPAGTTTTGPTGVSSGHHTATHGTAGYTNTHPTTGGLHNTSHTTGGLHDTTRPTGTDKAVGKTKEKAGEWKNDPRMQAEGAVRATEGKPAALGHGAHGMGATHPNTGALNTTSHHPAGLHDTSCPTATDKVVGKTEEKVGNLKRDPHMQAEGAMRATDGKVATHGAHFGMTDLGNTGSIGLSSGHHNTTQGLTGTHSTTNPLSSNSGPTGGLHKTSNPTGELGATGLNDPLGLNAGVGRTDDLNTATQQRFGDQSGQL